MAFGDVSPFEGAVRSSSKYVGQASPPVSIFFCGPSKGSWREKISVRGRTHGKRERSRLGCCSVRPAPNTEAYAVIEPQARFERVRGATESEGRTSAKSASSPSPPRAGGGVLASYPRASHSNPTNEIDPHFLSHPRVRKPRGRASLKRAGRAPGCARFQGAS